MFDQIESLAPINIADIVLECHREDEHKGHVEGYYRACESEHVELRYFDSEFMGEWVQGKCGREIGKIRIILCSISRKKISQHKYQGHTFISTETLPRCSIDGYYDKLQRDSEDKEKGFCSDKWDWKF